jgi:HD-GYP domain-containing protein (c-di-GMP phosphodiesterase class II)
MNRSIAEAVLYHHERFDGQGYIGLNGEKIPLFSRIISVADAFDVMTNIFCNRQQRATQGRI